MTLTLSSTSFSEHYLVAFLSLIRPNRSESRHTDNRDVWSLLNNEKKAKSTSKFAAKLIQSLRPATKNTFAFTTEKGKSLQKCKNREWRKLANTLYFQRKNFQKTWIRKNSTRLVWRIFQAITLVRASIYLNEAAKGKRWTLGYSLKPQEVSWNFIDYHLGPQYPEFKNLYEVRLFENSQQCTSNPSVDTVFMATVIAQQDNVNPSTAVLVWTAKEIE